MKKNEDAQDSLVNVASFSPHFFFFFLSVAILLARQKIPTQIYATIYVIRKIKDQTFLFISTNMSLGTFWTISQLDGLV